MYFGTYRKARLLLFSISTGNIRTLQPWLMPLVGTLPSLHCLKRSRRAFKFISRLKVIIFLLVVTILTVYANWEKSFHWNNCLLGSVSLTPETPKSQFASETWKNVSGADCDLGDFYVGEMHQWLLFSGRYRDIYWLIKHLYTEINHALLLT